MTQQRQLSAFTVTSYGGGGMAPSMGRREIGASLLEKLDYLNELLQRAADLESKMDEIFNRPKMEHSDPDWAGFHLRWGVIVGDKPNPFNPRWVKGTSIRTLPATREPTSPTSETPSDLPGSGTSSSSIGSGTKEPPSSISVPSSQAPTSNP